MKSRLLILSIAAFLLTGLAVAQSGWTVVANFDAPFNFIVSGTTLPAGHYFVKTSSNLQTLILQNADTGQSAIANNNNIILTEKPQNTHETSKVVFYPDSNGRQVLHQIMIVGDDHTHDLIHDSSVPELPKR
jgi:hypothetical protein